MRCTKRTADQRKAHPIVDDSYFEVGSRRGRRKSGDKIVKSLVNDGCS